MNHVMFPNKTLKYQGSKDKYRNQCLNCIYMYLRVTSLNKSIKYIYVKKKTWKSKYISHNNKN